MWKLECNDKIMFTLVFGYKKDYLYMNNINIYTYVFLLRSIPIQEY